MTRRRTYKRDKRFNKSLAKRRGPTSKYHLRRQSYRSVCGKRTGKFVDVHTWLLLRSEVKCGHCKRLMAK